MSRYNFKENEAKWQAAWQARRSFGQFSNRSKGKYWEF